MKNKEEIIKEWQLKYGYVNTEYIVKGWNAAIDMAAGEARINGSVSAPNGIAYKYDPKSQRSYWIDKQSITDLKFDI